MQHRLAVFICVTRNMSAAGLLQKKSQEGTQTTMEATLMAQQTPAQREQVYLTSLSTKSSYAMQLPWA